MKKLILAATLPALLALGGCQSTTKYVAANDKNTVIAGLSQRDFEGAANKALQEIIASPLLIHPEAAKGGRYILSIYNILNDTTQRIDTDQLVKKIRVGLLKSGKFLTTTAVNFTGAGPEDTSTQKSRQLADSAIMNQATVKQGANVVAPDFSLSGKIIQKNNRINRSEQLVEYYFQLTLTNIDNGLAYWEGEYPIAKTTDNDTVTW